MNTHVLENDCLKITLADRGAELISVYDKEEGAERIWTADPAIWNRHAPILFPFVGRVTDGKYRVDGREFAMKTQHGFARDMVFTCTEETASAVGHRLLSTAETRENYPYDFSLTVRHSIEKNNPRRLLIDWTVENTGDELMYYSIGGHPGFLMPEGVRKEDCCISFPGREQVRYFGASSAGFALPDRVKEIRLDGGLAKYQDDIPDTWIMEDQQIGTVGIAGPDRRPYVTVDCRPFPMLAVWANRNGPFICLEPWFGRTDNEGFSGSLEEKKGMEKLAGKEKKRIRWSIEFHRLSD